MRSIKVMVVAVSAVLMVGGAAYGFDLGSSIGNKVKEGAQAGGKMAVERQINKSLAEKNCSFRPKTTDLSCDLSDILKTLREQKMVAEKSGFSNGVDIFAEVGQGKDSKNPNLGNDRLLKVRTELIKKVSWWSWNDTSVSGDGLRLSVRIH